MATIAELKARVATQLNRDDMGSGGALEAELASTIADAIDLHASELFWFNRVTGPANTAASTATVALPTGMRRAVNVTYLGEPLRKVQLEEIEGRTETGSPTCWAENGSTVQLWPIPNSTYALSIFGTADLGVPANAGDSNAWTTTAYALTLATTKKLLCRDTLRDQDGFGIFSAAEQEELGRLRRETRKRNVSPLATDVPRSRHTFNINTGR